MFCIWQISWYCFCSEKFNVVRLIRTFWCCSLLTPEVFKRKWKYGRIHISYFLLTIYVKPNPYVLTINTLYIRELRIYRWLALHAYALSELAHIQARSKLINVCGELFKPQTHTQRDTLYAITYTHSGENASTAMHTNTHEAVLNAASVRSAYPTAIELPIIGLVRIQKSLAARDKMRTSSRKHIVSFSYFLC